ncbi:MAG: peptidylprolyl isomerase [Chitinophagaceae bacterium]|jgi:peptidyl-prolyl cis-trans isomerase D|nr:peptidylprolyl isomerase [Chitinophagaceae bacterium]
MSVIQSIRDKYARISVVAIALALLGFIMMDAFSGRSNLFGDNATTIGSVDGNDIDYLAFEQKLRQQEAYQQQQGYPVGSANRQQLLESTWNQEINQILLESEFEKLGFEIGKGELTDMLFGKNPPQDLAQRFTDPNTGIYDAAQAQQLINQVKNSRNQQEIDQLNQYLAGLEFTRKMEKYSSLLGNSIHFPKWLLEKQNADDAQIANISYVAIPYSSIMDTAVKVTDAEIKDYISKHKEDYQQKENRSISYVMFDASATSADSGIIFQELTGLKEEFTTSEDAAVFLNRYGSAIKYNDGFTGRTQMQTANQQMSMPYKDSILNLNRGEVYGPYVDGNSHVLAKMIDIKTLPDSARVRHILIQTMDPQSGTMLLDDSTASKRADSIHTAIRSGANFEQLVLQYSNDQGSVEKGGVYEFFPQGQMVKTFNDFSFENPVGTSGVVKTEFGYHIVEVLGHKGSQPYYKVAYFAKPIVPSNETENAVSNAAIQFAGDSRNLASFNANFDKQLKGKGTNKILASNIEPNAFTIEGIGTSRELVKEIYKADKGDVLQPIRVDDKYIVAAITEVNEEGLASPSSARSRVEPVLVNQKKAELIKKKIGAISTLEAASTASGQPIQTADSLRLNNAQNPALGFEMKVIGAAFNPANKGKVIPEAIEGQSGVYIVRVDNVSATPVQSADIDAQRRNLEMQMRQQMMYRNNPADVLKKAADIEDNRAKFY